MSLTVESAKQALTSVEDPGIHRVDLIKHRIVSDVEVSGDKAVVKVVIPTPAYPDATRRELEKRIEAAVSGAGASAVSVESTVETAWTPPPSEKALLPGVKNIIAVAAGKGGVGKSTVATNLALALAETGASVGLLDADVFGPSIPLMLGPPQVEPQTTDDQRIVPGIHHGMKVISVGFFVNPKEAVVWRGPMVHRLLQQFLGDVEWGDLDYLVCDLPPGTGDVQLSLSQLIPITGAVMVTTPQEVAISDVIKGIAMFEKVEIPILGVVENMSNFTCPSCGHVEPIFATGGGERLASEIGAVFLGAIPIDSRIRTAGDTGLPLMVADKQSPQAQRFREIASTTALEIAGRVLSKPRRAVRLSVIR